VGADRKAGAGGLSDAEQEATVKLKRWEIVVEYRDHPNSVRPDYELPYYDRYFTRQAAERTAAERFLDEDLGITHRVRKSS
jgi:hypothetical protein